MHTILCLDLELTCADDGSIPPEAMETIEIGACWVNAAGAVIDQFQTFVRPIVNPDLTAFCIGLTGIQQADLVDAPIFPAAAALLRDFVTRHQEPESTWTSWGVSDLRQFACESVRYDMPLPIALPHQNAKKLFAKAQRIGKQVGLAKATQLANLSMSGSHHRGLDDALSVAKLLPWVLGERLLKEKSCIHTR